VQISQLCAGSLITTLARTWRGGDNDEVVKHGDLPLTAVYDAQCEICQAAVSWIRVLDRRGVVRCVAIQDGPLSDVHPALEAPW
jgi:hypothetical protein